MASHARPKPSRVPRGLLRAGLAVSAAGAALTAAGTASAHAAPPTTSSDTGAAASALTGALKNSTAGGIAPLKNLQLDPLANTSADPLDNAVGTQIADFKPLSTTLVTAPLSSGGALKDLPLAGPATGVLPG